MKTTRRLRKNPAGSIAALDIGTSKIACFIAHADAAGEMKILGIGHQLSRGIRSGIITDFAEAEASIAAAVHAAEQMAGEMVENVLVSLSGGNLTSRNVTVEMTIVGEEVTDRDLMDIIDQGRASVAHNESEIIHCIPVSYYLDGARGISDPRKMFGRQFGADLHIITGLPSVTRNLAHCVARCHLNVEEYVAAPYASALSVLDDDEKQLGVTLIDMGGGVTSFAVFAGGKNLYTDAIPIGGSHVTSDIARGLSTSLAHAERLKTLHGSAIASARDDQVMVEVPPLGEEEEGEANTLPRSMLTGVIRPRMEEIFEMIRGKIEISGAGAFAGKRVVLTGGASQLIGAREMAGNILGKQVRLGRPRQVHGLAEAASGPAFATALGILEYTLRKPMEEQMFAARRARRGLTAGFEKVVGWFKENF
ncbi:MAG: cell division protein FtsA [Pseudomonadota bacterium]|nr:cell division protein FtsA [Pseudomonadota bacterium]MDE3038637.1 cell division protein FtsA [Pseudomonadota bacterium]